MSKTLIDWTDSVWNPVCGCSRQSEGCLNCYAEKMHKRLQAMGLEKYKEPFNKVRLHEPSLSIPSKTKKPTVFFVNSMSDLFHEDMKIEWIAEVWKQMVKNPQHIFLILTKRPEKLLFLSFLQDETENKEKELIPDNIWLGVTVESSKYLHRAETLQKIPAKHKFISFEPLLDDMNYLGWNYLKGIDWLIVGGETGPGARKMNYYGVKNIFVANKYLGKELPIFFKQWGSNKQSGIIKDTFLSEEECQMKYNEYLRYKQFPFEIEKLMEGKKKKSPIKLKCTGMA
jgi:protein gp37